MKEPRGDQSWMRRALALAYPWAGRTWPNPTVGACLVREGTLLSTGVHRGPGEVHAEVDALQNARDAGIDPRGATLYVTLEPCHHQGRTPPCTRGIVAAGIERVVYAVADRNPRVSGDGGDWLRDQGLLVDAGVSAAAAAELNHPYFDTDAGERAHVTLKLAMSADGKLARRAGPVADPRERRISGERAHRRAHQLRARSSAVLVGRRTAAWDRPRLDARHVGAGHRPRPIILDSRLSVPIDALPPGALVFCAQSTPEAAAVALAAGGHEVVRVETDRHGLAWEAIFDHLHRRGLGRVLIEGGASVAHSLLAAGAVHRLHLFLAPLLAGGDAETLDLPAMDRQFKTLRSHRLGPDLEWVMGRA